MDLDLRINGVAFVLGEGIDVQKLASASCRKVGFWGRLAMKVPQGETVFWAKNCEISCLGNRFTLRANLDTSTGADMMLGTSAFMYFTRNRVLENVMFQILENEFASVYEAQEFHKLLERTFGDPSSRSPNRWLDDHSAVTYNLHHTRTRALFTWTTRQYLDGHKTA